MTCQQLDHKSLAEIVRVFLHRFVSDTKQRRQILIVHLLAGIVDEMVGESTERLDVAYLEALLYVLAQDGLYQALHIRPLVMETLHFREPAVVDVVHECLLAGGIGLGGDTLHVNLMILAIFQKGERIKVNLIVPSGKVGGQFAAEQLGVATCHEDMEVCTQQAVHKQIPPVHILYLVKHQIRDVCPVQLVDTGKHRIQVLHLHPGQTVIVKVDIPISYAALQQHFVA